jgi:hypothetical protein
VPWTRARRRGEPRTIAANGSRIIAALEQAWAAIQDQRPDVPDVVVVTIEVTAEATDFRRVPADLPHATATADGQTLRAVCFGQRSVAGRRPAWRPAHRRRPERGTPRHPPAAHADRRRLRS